MGPRSPERATLAVVVPALNEAENLPRLLRSLGLREGAGSAGGAPDVPDEVIVVDGGSTDASREIAARHGARVATSERGRGVQLAEGARLATADLLLFLHADVRLEPGSIAAVRDAFRPPEVVATGMRQRVDGAGWVYRGIERAANRRVAFGWVYGDSGLCVRRSVYDEVGGFRELPLFEDLDLSRRLRRRGRVALVRESLVHVSPRRWQEEGALRRTVRNWMLTAAWALGMDPARLERYYRPHSQV